MPVNEALEIAHTRDTVRTQIFDGKGFPQMRLGWARVNADTLPAVPRRALAETVTRLDGSPFG